MFANRCLRMFAACAVALVTFAVALTTHAENWTYRADLGGWKDNETGLVWGQSSRVWNPSSWYSYDGAVQVGIPTYRQMTGNSKWRLPTLAEATTAHSHNAIAHFAETGRYEPSVRVGVRYEGEKAGVDFLDFQWEHDADFESEQRGDSAGVSALRGFVAHSSAGV